MLQAKVVSYYQALTSPICRKFTYTSRSPNCRYTYVCMDGMVVPTLFVGPKYDRNARSIFFSSMACHMSGLLVLTSHERHGINSAHWLSGPSRSSRSKNLWQTWQRARQRDPGEAVGWGVQPSMGRSIGNSVPAALWIKPNKAKVAMYPLVI